MPPQIVFLGQRASPLCGRLVLIGRKTDVVRHVQSLFAQDGVALTLAQSAVSAAQVSAHSGAKAHATLPPGPVVGEHVLDFHAVMLPAEATRYNSALRADVITRHFGGVATSPSLSIGSDNDDDGGTEAKRDCKVHVEVLVPGGVAVGAAVLSSAAAMVRSLPEYTRKGDKHATSSKTQIAACFLSAHDGGFDLVEDELLLQHAAVVAREVRACARLVDMPCNELNCTTFAQHVQERVASLSSVEYKEIVGTELQDQGFGGIYGVGKAAEHPPRLVILSHTPADASETYVLAGKGIVYDTGGLSIKDKAFMPGMKRDMGGAAGVLGAFCALVESGYKQNLHCLLALAENSVASNATRPDDIHVLFSGKTVEINNTDAEGRLVLADAVAYAAKTFNPKVILNMCTLTGAQGIATGKRHASLVCSSEQVEQELVASGKATGDLCHPMMWCPEFFSDEFSSAVADMKNSVKNRSNAQVSCAAQFIGDHLPNEFFLQGVWAHVDMAYPSFDGERATGYGVSLVFDWLMSYHN